MDDSGSVTELDNKTILLVGLGLIGGSLALALRARHAGQRLLAVDIDQDSLQLARQQQVINDVGTLAELAPQADLVVLATPPLTSVALIPELVSHCATGTVITDVASVKLPVLQAVNRQPQDFVRHFVPGHPIAGSEQSGFRAASADLFKGSNTILCPQPQTAALSVALVHQLWRRAGARVFGMTAQRHDQVLAATSHLPHLLAFASVELLRQQPNSEEMFRHAAGGFADFSRVASSDAGMWSQILVTNAEATLSVLDQYIVTLQDLQRSIHQRDQSALQQVFERAGRLRNGLVNDQRRQQPPRPPGQSGESMFVTAPGGCISGNLRVPGDKSISHRAVLLGALADGVTRVRGLLEGEDVLRTVAACREMGVTMVGPEHGDLTIFGVGKEGLQASAMPLDMGNSGTAMRLLAGLLSAQPFDSVLCGDASLQTRPMARIAEPLRAMGAVITTEPDGTPPLRISGRKLQGIHYNMPVASAQVKSCLLLAGMYGSGQTSITEPAVCRDHTERMLQGFNYPVQGGYPDNTVCIDGGHRLQAASIEVPADISSAAFFLVAASIAPGSELLLQQVGVNPTRLGIINLLRAMGADIRLEQAPPIGGEPVADIRVRYSRLSGILIPREQVPLAIDEFPVLLVAAACAEGETVLRNAAELRVKETDRIAAMAAGLTRLGVALETYADGIRITGGPLQGGRVDSLGDHRIAMAFAVAGLRASGPIEITNVRNVATSFPAFPRLATAVGLRLEELSER